MKTVALLFCLLSCAPGILGAQEKNNTDERFKALEERISALEAQIQALKAAQTASLAAPAAAQPVPAPPSPLPDASAQTAERVAVPPPAPSQPQAATPPQAPQTVTATPVLPGESAGQLPVYGGASALAKALNPDVSVIGDFLGSAGRNPVRPVPALEMHESEVGLQAIVDPYARADFFLSFGEEGVNLEEGFITFTALPAGLVAKVGKMRSAFGKVNTLHNHVLPWTDRPLVTGNLVGGEDGIDDAGFSVTRAFAGPKDIFLEATGQLFRGDSADLFSEHARRDVSTVAHLRGYKDITESTNLDIGASYARGHNTGYCGEGGECIAFPSVTPLSGPVTSLYGTDVT